MKIVLSGVETFNKGAELMLYSILQEIEREYPMAIVYIPLSSVPQGLNYISTTLNFRYQPLDVLKNRLREWHIEGLLRKLKLNFLIIDDIRIIKNADFFINANGFAFSDQCGLTETSKYYWKKILSGYSKQGTKIIFMPQAFGPINKQITKDIVGLIDEYADLIMPREKQSMNYLLKFGINKNKYKIYTDFTSLVEGIKPIQYSHLYGKVCLIPNTRMIEQGVLTLKGYVELFKIIQNIANRSGKQVYLLNHESCRDEMLCYEIMNSIKNPNIEVVSGLNSLEVKGMISTSFLCVSSRFHGVASSLNSGIPCLATSWSHKYSSLYEDYKLEGCLLNTSSLSDVEDKINKFLNPAVNNSLRNYILEQKKNIVAEVNNMWKEIWKK